MSRAPYEWKVLSATLAAPNPGFEPPPLEEMLNSLEQDGWEIFTIVADIRVGSGAFNRARVVVRRESS